MSSSSDPAVAAAFAAARQMCRRAAPDLYFASFFLPPRKRSAAHAIVAFCQMIREAIDVSPQQLVGAGAMREHPAVVSPRALPVIQPQVEPSHCETGSPQSRIEMLAERLDEIDEDRLELPAPEARSEQQHALFAFAQTIRRVEVPRQRLLDFAAGRRLDLMMMRCATWDQLEEHCHRAGGIVAIMLSGALGLTHSDAFAQAATLGKALRLTQVLRDVKRDVNDGRVYLPQDEMSRFGYSERDLTQGVVNESFRALMRFQVDRARNLYRAGAEAICWLAGDGSRMTAATLAVLGGAVLRRIEQHGYDVFSRRAELTTPQRFRQLPLAWRLARREAGGPLPEVF